MTKKTPGKEVEAPKRKNEPQPLDLSNDLWLRQKGETEKAYAEFTAYRDSEERRTRDHANGFYNSVRWSWQERVKAWDEFLSKKEAEKMLRYRLNMHDRHRNVARAMMEKGAQYIEGITDEQLKEMKPAEVIKLIEAAARIESEASRGDQPDVTVGVTTRVVDLSARKADQRMDELMQELQRRRELRAAEEAEALIDEGEIVNAE